MLACNLELISKIQEVIERYWLGTRWSVLGKEGPWNIEIKDVFDESLYDDRDLGHKLNIKF